MSTNPPTADIHDFEAQSATLAQQLENLERIALVAGWQEAADWLRENAKQILVWAEDGAGSPRHVMLWVAQAKGMPIITCAVCERPATQVDSAHPYFQSKDRCEVHVRHE